MNRQPTYASDCATSGLVLPLEAVKEEAVNAGTTFSSEGGGFEHTFFTSAMEMSQWKESTFKTKESVF